MMRDLKIKRAIGRITILLVGFVFMLVSGCRVKPTPTKYGPPPSTGVGQSKDIPSGSIPVN